MVSSILLGKLLAIAALIIFSISILVTKAASNRLNLNLGFLVSVAANVFFCIVLFVLDSLFRPHDVQWKSLGFGLFVLAGVFSTYFGRWFFFEAIVRFGAAKASIYQVSSPAFVAIIAWAVLGERLAGVALAGMALTLAGLLLVSYVPGTFSRRTVAVPVAAETGSKMARLAAIGNISLLLGLASAASYAVSTVLRGVAVRDWNEPILGALLGASSGLAMQLMFNTNLRDLYRDIKVADRRGMMLFAINGALTIAAQICAIASLRYIPVALSNLITLCSPVLIVPISYFILKNREGIGARTWIGGALTMAGIAVIVLSR
ncbi:MAG: DMT family transporter [Pseudomonadota bacterium]